MAAGAYDTSYNSLGDVFVSKFNYFGTSLVYSTYIGGSGEDCANAIVVDGSGSVIVTGRTGSSNFPTTAGAFDQSHGGGKDIFITKLNAAGSVLLYSTFLGGSADDGGTGVAVDSSGNAYISGKTKSSNFPTTSGAFDTSYNGSPYLDTVVSKLDPSGASLAYSTYLGGNLDDAGFGIAIDAGGMLMSPEKRRLPTSRRRPEPTTRQKTRPRMSLSSSSIRAGRLSRTRPMSAGARTMPDTVWPSTAEATR